MMNATPDPLFDRLVRLRLEQVQCLPDFSGWDRLQAALDALDLQYAAFDTAVAHRLDLAADLTHDTPDFTTIAHALADPFDTLMATRLQAAETLPVSPSPADWQAFEALLPHPFDQQLQHKLSDYELPEQPADWSEVAAHLPAGFDGMLQQRMAAATDPGKPAWREFDAVYAAAIAGERLQGHVIPERADWPAFQRKWAATESRVASRNIYWVARISAVAAAIALLVVAGSQWLSTPTTQTALLAAQTPQTVAGTPAEQTQAAENPGDALHPRTPLAATTPLPPHAAPAAHFLDTYAGVPPTYDFDQFEAFEAEPLLKSGGLMTRASSVQRSGAQQRQADMRLLQPLMAFGGGKQPPLAATRSFGSQPEGVSLPRTGISPAIWVGLSGTTLGSVAELNSKALLGHMIGLRMYLQMGRKWGLTAGLQTGTKQFEQVYLDLNTAGTAWVQSRTVGKIRLLEFPVLMRYEIGPAGSSTRLYVQGGLAPSLTLREQFTLFRDAATESNLLTVQEEARLRTYAGTLHFAPGVVWSDKHQKIQVQAEPYLQIGLQPLSDARSKLSSAGLTLNVLYRVK